MQTTFLATAKGVLLQFNRILYPLRYCLLNKEAESDGKKYIFTKNQFGVWNCTEADFTDWLKDLASEINNLIEENEATFVRDGK